MPVAIRSDQTDYIDLAQLGINPAHRILSINQNVDPQWLKLVMLPRRQLVTDHRNPKVDVGKSDQNRFRSHSQCSVSNKCN